MPKIIPSEGQPGRRAFTLIELLVVIAIIGVLAGIAVPVLAKVRESGNSVKCSSNLRQICVALNLYAADNNNGYPALTGYTNPGGSPDWDVSAIDPYLPERSKNGRQNVIFICPSAKYATGANSTLSRTYSAAETLIGPDPTATDPNKLYGPWKFQRIRTSLVSTAGSLLLFDGTQDPLDASHAYCTLEVPWVTLTGTSDLQANGTASTSYIDYRHNRAFNALFADGHVGKINRADAATSVTKQMWTGRTN